MKKDSNRKSKNHFWLSTSLPCYQAIQDSSRDFGWLQALAVVWMPPGHLWWWGGLHSGGESTSTEAHSMFLVFSSNMFLKMIIDDTICIFAHPLQLYVLILNYMLTHAWFVGVSWKWWWDSGDTQLDDLPGYLLVAGSTSQHLLHSGWTAVQCCRRRSSW